MILEKLQNDMVAAMKSGQSVCRDVLKVVIAEAKSAEVRQNKSMTDDQVFNLIRKVIEGNTETLRHLKENDERYTKLTEENRILNGYLPTMLALDAVLSHLTEKTGEITTAKSDGQATGIAMKWLKGLSLSVDGNTVTLAVKQIRSTK